MSTDLPPIPPATVGVDAGASLCKLVLHRETLETARYSSAELAAVRSRIQRWQPKRIAATGGGAPELGGDLDGIPIERVPEFDAWAHGARLLAARSGMDLPDAHILVSLGTGTSVLAIHGGKGQRVGGSALGGGTLLGLGQILLGASSFDEIARLAEQGDRRHVDLLVRDIYRSGGIPLHPDLNAASFGKLASGREKRARPEDMAHALMGLVGENIGIICAVIARAAQLEDIVYCGSTLTGNPALQQILELVSTGLSRRAWFLEDGAYCGAVGAAALATA